MKQKMGEKIAAIARNWDSIPQEFKTTIYTRPEQEVILLLDRQKPSVEADYSFDEERVSVNKNGQIVWGFDSGCSCPSPWHDNAPDCYSCANTWKEFTLSDVSGFDEGWLEEIGGVLTKLAPWLK